MRKAYAIAEFLSDDNKLEMKKTAGECGFDIAFFDSDEEAAGKVSDAEVIYCKDPQLFGEMRDLKWCHSAFAGVGPFISSGVFDNGSVILTNSSGSYGLTISEYVVMVTLMLMKRMPEYEEIIRERRWTQSLSIRSIAGSRIAIIGTGDIGRNAAKRYKALGAESVTGFSRSGRPSEYFDKIHRIDEFEEVMGSESFDVLLLCVPGTPDGQDFCDKCRTRSGHRSGRAH